MDGKIIQVWDLSADLHCELVLSLTEPQDLNRTQWVRSTMSADGRWLALWERNARGGVLYSIEDGEGSLRVLSKAEQASEPNNVTTPMMSDRGHFGTEEIVGVAFSPDASSMAVAFLDGTVQFGPAGGTPSVHVAVDSGPTDAILDIAVDPQGEKLAIAVRQEVSLWSWSGHRIGRLAVDAYKVFHVSFSPDGEHIVTLAENSNGSAVAELWTRTGGRVAHLKIETSATVPATYTTGGHILLANGRGIAVIDRAGTVLATISGANGTRALVWAASPDGNLIAVAFSDGLARLWDVRLSRRILTLTIGPANSIGFDPDGKMLLVAFEGPLRRFALHTNDLLSIAAQRVTRPLTRDERERFNIETPRLTMDVIKQHR